MTLFFTNHQIQVYRRRQVINTNRFTLSATGTVHPVDLQPTSPERAALMNAQYGQVYTAYIDSDVDVAEGDQIVIDGVDRYSVRGIARYGGAGLLDYIELTLVSQDAHA